MATSRTTSTLAGFAGAAILAIASLVFIAAAPGTSAASAAGPKPTAASYAWPVKPFDQAHPVRANFGDPRTTFHGTPTQATLLTGNGSFSFHFGVDIAVPDGTPVYAVEAGTIWFDNPQAIAVVALDRSHSFGYWHVIPVVKSHQHVALHQLIAHVAKGWGHVHFAERRAGAYVNPLRNGGLGPYTDRTAPTVDEVYVYGSSLAAVAHDTPDPTVPGEWADEPVTPALLRWRILSTGSAYGWKTAVDFRSEMLDSADFTKVYTPETRQNHKGQPGMYSFYLARTWRANTAATVQVEVSDTAGNVAVYTAQVARVDAGL